MTDKKKSPSRPLSAGGEIDAWCTRCRMDLVHRIVAMVGSKPKRVMCMTCDSEHNYRAPKSEEVAAKKSSTTTKKKLTKKAATAASSLEEWESRTQCGKPLTRYSIHEVFSLDQLVHHKKFGDGYVIAALDSKVTISFVDGERNLVQGVPQ